MWLDFGLQIHIYNPRLNTVKNQNDDVSSDFLFVNSVKVSNRVRLFWEEHLKHSQRLDSIDERILRNVSCYNFHCGRRLQYYVCPSARLWARLWGIWEEAKNEEAGAQFPLRGAVTQWKLSNLGLVWNANQFDIHLFQTWRWLGTVFNRPETDLDI